MATVVWINGPFGVGKTTVAGRLACARAGALVFDPEIVGAMLRSVVPGDLQRPDYQDMPIWRALVRRTAEALLADYRRPLIVPMTIVVPDYHDEIVGGLRRSGVDLAHFTLLASPETVRARLALRGDEEWALAQLSRCLPALEDELFAEHIETDGRSADDVADLILARLE